MAEISKILGFKKLMNILDRRMEPLPELGVLQFESIFGKQFLPKRNLLKRDSQKNLK